MKKTRNNKIYCIGDSHVRFFSGRSGTQPEYPNKSKNSIPFFESYRLGAVLAYNLCKTGTKTRGREKLFELLETIPKGSNVLLSFGEIDCRLHLIKKAEEQNKFLDEVVSDCVKRYFSVINEIKNDFNIIIWGVIPSTKSESILDSRYPHYGSCIDRNKTTKIFNNKLKILSEKTNVKFISIFNDLVDKNGITKSEFYIDNIHLSQKIIPLVINNFKKKLPELEIILLKNKFLSKLPYNIQLNILKLNSKIKTFFYIFFIKIKIKKHIKKLTFITK